MSKFFAPQQALLTAQYPQLAEHEIVMMGTSLDTMSAMPHDVVQTAQDLEVDGLDREDAIGKAVEAHLIRCEAPEGYMFARVVKDDAEPVLVTLKV